MLKNTSISPIVFPILLYVFLLTVIVPLNPSSVMADEHLIQNTCKNTPNYELCASTLKADPISLKTDLGGLGTIVVNVIQAKSTTELQSLNKIADSNPDLKSQLSKCISGYNLVLTDLIPETLTAPPEFKEHGMQGVVEVTKNCSNIFRELKLPVSANNKLVLDLSGVAIAIIRMLV